MENWMLWIGGFLLLALLGLSIYRLAESRSRPRTVRASVLEKKLCGRSQVTVGHYGFLNRSDRVALFSLDGRTEGLYCDEALYEALQAGDRGLLTLQGGRALSFQKDGAERAPCASH